MDFSLNPQFDDIDFKGVISTRLRPVMKYSSGVPQRLTQNNEVYISLLYFQDPCAYFFIVFNTSAQSLMTLFFYILTSQLLFYLISPALNK